MEKRILLLEDDLSRVTWFRQHSRLPVDVTDDVSKAKELLKKNNYSKIFLDHDLTFEHYRAFHACQPVDDATTGYAIALYLSENPKISPDAEIIIHSYNEKGADRMWRKIRETRRRSIKQPFNQLTEAQVN